MPTTDTNVYLSGNYAPVAEEVTALDLPVTGTLPPELSGRYLRNGPNPLTAPDPATYHWFTGDGMVHGVRLSDGRAEWYRNRWVGSQRLAESRGGTDIEGPNWNGGPVGPNTNVGGFAGTTWAMVEGGGTPVELTYELDTIARNDFSGTLPGAFSAHPKLDPRTGELHAMAYAWRQWQDHAQYVVVGADGRVSRSVDIPLPGPTMLHDMALTGRYAIVFDQPCIVDRDLAEQRRFPFRWCPDYGNRVGLLPRSGGAADIVWIDVPLGYAFHPLNAYDVDGGRDNGGDRVIVDLCVYDRMFDADLSGPFESLPRLERWELDPARRTASVTVIDAGANEFPRHRSDLSARPYRYGYCVAIANDLTTGWATVKHDLVTGERRVFDHGPGRAAGEAVFVPRSGAGDSDEDDGWLITFVHDLGRGTAELVVIDAAEFDRAGYVASVALPARVPFGFHGNWVSDRTVQPGAERVGS